MNRKIIDKLLILFLIIMAASGFLIRPLSETMIIIAIHKLSAVVFCVLCVFHGLQYRKRKIKIKGSKLGIIKERTGEKNEN